MRRLSREAIRMRIHVALSVLPPAKRQSVGIIGDLHREAVLEDLVMRIMGPVESETVMLVPSLVGPAHSPRHGRWEEDEPHPHPDLPASDH
jgi:hypothetical protein